jgi:vacuolar-type H+-ATPase subunit E/Vma4
MERLSSAILDKVNADARDIIKEAEERARSIIDKAKEQQKTRSDEERLRLTSEASTEAARIQAQAAIKARQETLAAKTRVIDEIIGETEKSLSALHRGKVLANLTGEGIKALGVDKVRVYVSPKDTAIMQKLLEEDVELQRKVIGINTKVFLGGVIVEDAGGNNRIDNTFETRLQILLPKILPEIGKELF